MVGVIDGVKLIVGVIVRVGVDVGVSDGVKLIVGVIVGVFVGVGVAVGVPILAISTNELKPYSLLMVAMRKPLILVDELGLALPL